MKTLSFALALAMFAAPLTALAQAPSQPAPQTFVFEEGEAVQGQPIGPVDYTLTVPPTSARRSLIRVRRSFLPELARAADAL